MAIVAVLDVVVDMVRNSEFEEAQIDWDVAGIGC